MVFILKMLLNELIVLNIWEVVLILCFEFRWIIVWLLFFDYMSFFFFELEKFILVGYRWFILVFCLVVMMVNV